MGPKWVAIQKGRLLGRSPVHSRRVLSMGFLHMSLKLLYQFQNGHIYQTEKLLELVNLVVQATGVILVVAADSGRVYPLLSGRW